VSEKVTQISAISGKSKRKRLTNPQKPPRHLRASTKRWFEQICSDYELESHHVMLLQITAEAWDEIQTSREAIEEHGATFENNHGDIKPRLEVAQLRHARNAFMRGMRELNLSEAPPDPPRPNPLRYGGKR
jgi:hypothetical protein